MDGSTNYQMKYLLIDTENKQVLKTADIPEKTAELVNIAYSMNRQSLKWVSTTQAKKYGIRP
jgi:hypothetical protein